MYYFPIGAWFYHLVTSAWIYQKQYTYGAWEKNQRRKNRKDLTLLNYLL